MPFLHIAKWLPSCLPSSSLVVNFQPIGANFRQKVAKVNNFLGVLGVFSGKSETKKGKSEIYFGFGLSWWLSLWGGGGVHWVHVVRSCSLSLGVFRPFALPLPSFLLCLWCIAFEYGFISRFKGVFSAFWGVRGGLCCLGALR